jgi:hypothetical protein
MRPFNRIKMKKKHAEIDDAAQWNMGKINYYKLRPE